MATKSFELEILTPKERVFRGTITSLIVPAYLGYLGVWADHAPLLATLTPGQVTYRDPNGQTTTLRSPGSGLLEVYHNHATLLVDEISP